jgi:multisubunit Na+/H+ antiporter MnhB subunit
MKFQDIVTNIVDILKLIVPLLIGASILIFLYGLLTYILNSADEAKRKESISYISYGIIGLFVMVSVWSLAYMLTEFFGLSFGIPQIRI